MSNLAYFEAELLLLSKDILRIFFNVTINRFKFKTTSWYGEQQGKFNSSFLTDGRECIYSVTP